LDYGYKSYILNKKGIMKKIYILMIISAFCLSGCDLDKEPETSISDPFYWKTAKDLRAACNRMYDELAGWNFSSKASAPPTGTSRATVDANIRWHDSRSDELVMTAPDVVSSGNWSPFGTSYNTWKDPYTRIFTANNIIEKAPQANELEEVINRWMAEAYFFRAYYYFQLVRMFGDVPYVTKAIDDPNDPDLYMGRTLREEVIQNCYKDLEFAATWLPVISAVKGDDWGRVSRSAALGLIVRIGLYEGTYSKYHNLGSDYRAHLKKSIDAADAMKGEGHDLYSDFVKLFHFEGEGAANKENVFVKVYGPNGSSGTTVHGHSRTMENSYSITRQMIDMFLYKDGLPREKSPLKIANETSYEDALKDRDPRLKMSVFSLGETAYKGKYEPFVNQSGRGYPIKKGFLRSEWDTNSKETIDNMIIRYGEILVSKAEALYEYNGSITDAQLEETINKLRGRVNFDVKLTNDFVSRNGLVMIDEIRRERVVELLDEGLHYDDIIRWKTAEKVLPTHMVGMKFVDSETTVQRKDVANRLTDKNGMLNGVKVYDQEDMYVIELADTRTFNPDRDYLYPLPSNDVALSKGNVNQNPKW